MNIVPGTWKEAMFVITHTTACETVINMKTHGQMKWYWRYHGDVTLPWYIPSHGSSKAWRAVTLWEVSLVVLPTQPIERDINCYRPSSFPASMSLSLQHSAAGLNMRWSIVNLSHQPAHLSHLWHPQFHIFDARTRWGLAFADMGQAVYLKCIYGMEE